MFKFAEQQCVSGATCKPWMWQRINSATADPEHVVLLRYAFVAKLITLENNHQSAAHSEWYQYRQFGKEQIIICVGFFYIVQSRFCLLCFAFLFFLPFTDEPLLGFLSFPLLSAILLVLQVNSTICWCFDASYTACQLILNNTRWKESPKIKGHTETMLVTNQRQCHWLSKRRFTGLNIPCKNTLLCSFTH